MRRPLLLTSGEPAGIGPDLCLSIPEWWSQIVVMGDKYALQERANLLGKHVHIVDYHPEQSEKTPCLRVWHIPCQASVMPGRLDPANASMVLKMLKHACQATLEGQFSALVTAPVHKAQLQSCDATFVGHTDFFANLCHAQVVMMLATQQFRVALVTTHLPLSQVPLAITQQKIIEVVRIVAQALVRDFGVLHPRIMLAGLNPHAGEQGLLGYEEQTIIEPAVACLQQQGLNVLGPYSADTMFLEKNVDAFVAMYHDQGLAVLKYASFGQAANISLGLPIIRTSVDHGTALELAGTGRASSGSLLVALREAQRMSQQRLLEPK